MPQYFLGIDNGSTMSKAALFTSSGEELAVASRKVELVEPRPGVSERDSEKMWQDTALAVRDVLSQSGIDAAEIACVACTGYGNGLHLVHRDGNLLRNGINSTDSRGQSYVDQWLADGVDEKVLPKTTQCLWPGQPNALLAWLRDNEPEAMANAGWVLMCKDYVRFRLCGQIHAELTDMSGTSLLNVVTGEYDDEILELFGIADMRDLLPPLVKTSDLCGEVTAQAASETGLKEGTPVAGGMFDIDACALASGIVDERQMSLVAGTWGNNQYVAKEPLIDKGLFMTSCYSIPGYYLMLEGSPTSANNLEWFVTEFFGAERALAEQAGKSVYDLCNGLVAATEPGDTDIVFLPFLYGANVEGSVKSCLVGLEGWHRRGHVLRAIYEGIIFGHNTHLRRLLQFRDAPEVIRFSGGAGRSQEWVQMFADCFQIPVEIPAGTELGALGAAIAAAVAVSCYGDYADAVEAMTGIARRHEPDPGKQELYETKYARYMEVIAGVRDLWNR